MRVHPREIEIGQYMQTPELRDDPRNHCIPFVDVLSPPGWPNERVIVMPMLRPYDDPPFEMVAEVMDYFHQVFEVERYFDIDSTRSSLTRVFTGIEFHAREARCPSVRPLLALAMSPS
jgi:hypothetical protein